MLHANKTTSRTLNMLFSEMVIFVPGVINTHIIHFKFKYTFQYFFFAQNL